MSFYLVDKKRNITSNKTLKEFKKEFNFKKAGFSGVLDPFATGLLIIATDGDTRLLERFLKADKTYTGTILFGRQTDTLDIDGNTIKTMDNFVLSEEKIQKTINEKFIGKILQVPPKFSNIKINGKKAHQLSRNNIEFELKPVEKVIKSFIVKNYDTHCIDFKVVVSSGTYIRALARDLGEELGVPAMLTVLRREAIDEIKVEQDQIIEKHRNELLKIKNIFPNDIQMKKFYEGKIVELSETDNELFAEGLNIILLLKKVEDGKYKISKRIA